MSRVLVHYQIKDDTVRTNFRKALKKNGWNEETESVYSYVYNSERGENANTVAATLKGFIQSAAQSVKKTGTDLRNDGELIFLEYLYWLGNGGTTIEKLDLFSDELPEPPFQYGERRV